MTQVQNSNVSNAQTLKVKIVESFSVDFLSDKHHSERLEFHLLWKEASSTEPPLEFVLSYNDGLKKFLWHFETSTPWIYYAKVHLSLS